MLKKSVPLSSLPIGEPLAQSIFDEYDRLLLRQGSILNADFIERLKSNNIDSVFIAIETKDMPEKEVEDRPKKPVSKPIPSNYYTLYNELLWEQDRIELRGQYKKPIQKEFLNILTRFIDVIKVNQEKSLEFFLNVKKLHTDYHYGRHHVNTGILAILIACWLDFDNSLIKEIAVSAMLHDIGETQIPSKILKKPSRLTDDERSIVQSHPTLGMQILSKTDWINNRELYGVLTHHERLNGQGYPYKLLGSKITIHARVTAVASIFNAATSNRPYANAKNILDILLELRNRSYGELDSKVTRVLYEKFSAYLQNNKKTIFLNNGDKGCLTLAKESKLIISGENGIYNLFDNNCPKVVNIS